jgi:hypothetical protein
MERISKDITFQDYVPILKAYFKQEKSFIKSLIVNRHGWDNETKDLKKKKVLKEERLQVKMEMIDIVRVLSCFKIFYTLKNDAKEETSRNSETIFRERDLAHMIKIIKPLKELIVQRINKNLEGIEVREGLEFLQLTRCEYCDVFYRGEFGHLCRWRRKKANALKVPELTTRNGDPIYLTTVTFNAQTVDEELDKFIMYKKQVEPQLPGVMHAELEHLIDHPSAVCANVYFRRCVSLYQREEWTHYREFMIFPLMYNKLIEERYVESSRIRQLVEKVKVEIQQLKKEEESFNYFEEEINILNGNTIQEVVAEISEVAIENDLKPITRKELEQLIDCEIAEHSIEMESEPSKRLQLIGIAAIKVIGDEEEYTRLRHKHFERHHYIVKDGEIKMLIGGRCIFKRGRCPFTNSDGECTKYCARLDSTRKDIKYLMRYLKTKYDRGGLFDIRSLFR